MRNDAVKYIVFSAVALLIYALCHDFGIFWDNVLFVSRMGNHLYGEGIAHLHIPVEIDPGHPPFIAWWQAFCWRLLGHSLWVSHLVMIPFHIAVMYQLHRLIQYFIEQKSDQWLVFAWIMCDPTLLTQFALVSPEAMHLFFLILALNGIFYQKKWHKILGLALLGIISYRGMMLCAGVFIFEFCWRKRRHINYTHYLIGALPAVGYILWRSASAGWVYTHPNSPWLETGGLVDLKGLLRNIVVMAKSYADFGRIFVFAILAFLLFKVKNPFTDQKIKTLILAAFCIVGVIIVVSLLLTNPMAHRYFLASYILLHLLTAYIIFQRKSELKKSLLPVIFIGLLTGNLWVYPEKIAQGWDASLAGMPYFSLRSEMIDYLNSEKISVEDVATFFPNVVPLDYVDMKGDNRSFIHFTGKEKYVLHATVFNLRDAEYDLLSEKYNVKNEMHQGRMKVTLYELHNH